MSRRRRKETSAERRLRRERSIRRARMGSPDWTPETPGPVWLYILVGSAVTAVTAVACSLVRAWVRTCG